MSVLVLGACQDSPIAPDVPIDRVAAARVTPSVTDARVRLAQGIENTVVRARVAHDLEQLELALTNGDGRKSRFHVSVLRTVLTDYRAQQGSAMSDGADVTAIVLTLFQVGQVVDAAFEFSMQ